MSEVLPSLSWTDACLWHELMPKQGWDSEAKNTFWINLVIMGFFVLFVGVFLVFFVWLFVVFFFLNLGGKSREVDSEIPLRNFAQEMENFGSNLTFPSFMLNL